MVFKETTKTKRCKRVLRVEVRKKDWYIKWVSSIILMISLLLTANNLFPYNLFIGVFGFIGWVVVAILWKDRSLILLNTTSLVIYINGIIGYLVDK